VAAEVEDRQREQALLDEEQAVQDAAGAAVAVGEGMDRLELVMRDRHAHERIERFLLVKKALPIGEELSQQRLAFGRGVHHDAGGAPGERGTRGFAHGHFGAFDARADRLGGARRERMRLQRAHALEKRASIAQRLLGRGVGAAVGLQVLEELVGRGDDVLDFGARPRLQHRQGIDEHRRIGNQPRGLLQLGERRARGHAALQNGLRLELRLGRQLRQLVPRPVGAPPSHVLKIDFLRHVRRLCRRRRHVKKHGPRVPLGSDPESGQAGVSRFGGLTPNLLLQEGE
jgi:hypothetical protein